MPDASQTLTIIVRLRDQASRGLRSMARGVQGFRNVIGRLGNAVFSLRGALVGLGTTMVARGFVQTAAAFEAMEVKLDALTKGRGVQTLEAINEWALRMPVDTRKAVQTFSMMQAMGLDPTIEKMQTLVDVSVLFGEDAMPRIARALGQMAASGRLSREELNQLTEVGINATKYIEQAFDMTVEQVQRAGMDISKVVKVVMDGLAKEFGGSATKMMDSWQGLTTTLVSYWVEFQRRVMGAGVFDAIKERLKLLNDEIGKLFESGRIDIWAHEVAVGVLTAFELMTQAVGFFVRSVIASQGVFNRIKLWFQEFELNAMKREFNHLVDILEGRVEPNFAVIDRYGENWKEHVQKRVGELAKEIGVLNVKAGETVDALVGNIENLEKFTELVEKAVEALRKAKETEIKRPEVEPYEPPPRPEKVKKPDEKLFAAALKKEAQEALEVNKTLMAAINQQYELHTMDLETYFKQRTDLIAEQYEIQNRLLEQQKAKAKPEQKPLIEAQQFALAQQHLRDMLSLEIEYRNAIKARGEAQKEADAIILGIRERIAELGVGDSLQKQFDLENEKMRRRQKEEIDAILALKEEGYEVEKQLQEAHLAHMEEREAQAAEQRKKIWSTYVGAISETLSGMTDMFLQWYQASGEKSKELFTLFKAASIAQALIATYESAVKAYNAMVGIPIVGPTLAATAAAVAIAAGMAKVQLIRQQQMAEGGEVMGYSPYERADNINIKATAGEWVHPVDTVRYYTKQGMDVIRKKLIPREVLLQYATPTFEVPTGTALAAGGMVSGVTGRRGEEDASQRSVKMKTVINLPENLRFISRRLEAEVEPVIMRILQEELKY